MTPAPGMKPSALGYPLHTFHEIVRFLPMNAVLGTDASAMLVGVRPIPDEFAATDAPWNDFALWDEWAKMAEKKSGRGPIPRTPDLDRCFGVSHEWLHEIAPSLAVAYTTPWFYRACNYLYDSMTRLPYNSVDWRDEGWDPKWDPFVEPATSEACFQDAFKSIEAVIGEPSKDRTEERIRERLSDQGIDPDEQYSTKVEDSLVQSIMRHHPTRDRDAAHGSGRKRPISVIDVLDAQNLARHIVLSVVP